MSRLVLAVLALSGTLNLSGSLQLSGSLIPADAIAFGMINRKFFDDFTTSSTIDLADSRGPGFNWYVHNAWPHAAFPWVTASPTLSSSISVSGGVLTIATDASGFGECLNTAVTANNAQGYNGTVFSGGFYAEARISFDPTLSQTTFASWPAFWMTASQFLTSNVSEFGEFDVFEAISDPMTDGVVSMGFTLHDWKVNNTRPVPIGSTTGQPSGFHTYGILWVPAVYNGGTGLVEAFYDGKLISSPVTTITNYSSTSGAVPAFVPVNPVGTFSIVDSQSFPIILGCGPNWPMSVDYVAVYQR